jgi:hypothetical protein
VSDAGSEALAITGFTWNARMAARSVVAAAAGV